MKWDVKHQRFFRWGFFFLDRLLIFVFCFSEGGVMLPLIYGVLVLQCIMYVLFVVLFDLLCVIIFIISFLYVVSFYQVAESKFPFTGSSIELENGINCSHYRLSDYYIFILSVLYLSLFILYIYIYMICLLWCVYCDYILFFIYMSQGDSMFWHITLYSFYILYYFFVVVLHITFTCWTRFRCTGYL
jgi:hypothetical protein